METTLEPRQCRAARGLLGWSADGLAEAAGAGLATVRRFETGASVRPSSVTAIWAALERAGVELIPADARSPSGGVGVRLKS